MMIYMAFTLNAALGLKDGDYMEKCCSCEAHLTLSSRFTAKCCQFVASLELKKGITVFA